MHLAPKRLQGLTNPLTASQCNTSITNPPTAIDIYMKSNLLPRHPLPAHQIRQSGPRRTQRDITDLASAPRRIPIM